MIVASGNVVHNLQTLKWREANLAYDWAERFDDAVFEQLMHDPADILRMTEHADYAKAVPTPDHFIPLLYVASLAAADNTKLAFGSRSYHGFDLHGLLWLRHGNGATTKPFRRSQTARRHTT